MSFVVRLIVLSIFVSLAASVTFTNAVKQSGKTITATTASNGILVTITGGGWIISDAITLTSASADVTWTTVVSSTGTTGVGLAGLSTCTPAIATSATTLIGRGSQGCPSDLVTLYNTQPTSPTSNTVQSTNVAVGTAVKWSLQAPASPSASNPIGVALTSRYFTLLCSF